MIRPRWLPLSRPRVARELEDPAGRTIYAIGDIHGRYDLLTALLPQLIADAGSLAEADRPLLLFLGDYVDRGPDSAAVLSALLWLARDAPVETAFLLGNHERMLLDFIEDPARGRGWLRVGGAETLRSYGVDLPADADAELDHPALRDALLDRLPASHLGFLQGLQLYVETDDYVFAHAGIRPGVAMAAQAEEDLIWIRAGFLDNERPFDKIVVHGHSWSSDEPVHRVNRIGVDTGAFKTGVLTAVRLRGGEVRFLQARLDPPVLAERSVA